MRIIAPSYVIETPLGPHILETIEQAGRTCYKSEDKITPESSVAFVRMLIKRGHHAMIEHGESIAVRFVCDRGISHEVVRHRLFSLAQESTRYCNYSEEKFDEQITVIDISPFCNSEVLDIWLEAVAASEVFYFRMIEAGAKAQIARSVLMNSLKTEIVVRGNPREWRHFFSLRADKAAHPQMRQLACPLLVEFRNSVPVLFDDVGNPNCEEEPCSSPA